ncbi:Chloride channel protein [hydrothermal vent metagenome]|uniref:Chloride channel protein n=1 Tax=hydrothermal vent metagenome TaxID=652676 RepID=A0A3B1A0T4_9ZZZZ
MRHHLIKTRRQLFSPKKNKQRLIFLSSALIVGAVAAFFAIAAQQADHQYLALFKSHPWVALAIPPLSLALIAWLTKNVFLGTEGSGIPQTIAALEMPSHAMRKKVLSLKIAFGKILLTIMGLFSGASIGREGPTVHVGASIIYSLHTHHGFKRQHMAKALIIAGGAAGISAAFNTPLAGIIFAIEEMSRNFERRLNNILLLAVILAGLTAIAILGEYTYFGHSNAVLPLNQYAWVAIIICGIGGGILGGLFSLTLIHGSKRLFHFARAHPIYLAFICGLLISLLGYSSNGLTFGTGYHEAKNLIDGGEATAGFPFMKLLATIASYLSGIPGGIFAPSLSIGAGFGANLAEYFPLLPAASLIILGMVGYFTGVVQTPITAFVIVMEMTTNSSLLLPLMATALIAKGFSKLVCPTPIYQALSEVYLANTKEPKTQS